MPDEIEIIMDEEDAIASELREVRRDAIAFYKRLARILLQYRGNKTLALHAYCLALGWHDEIECETAVEVAVKLFKNPKKKAAVSKLVKVFQDVTGLEGQRSNEGRESMAQARKNQLKK